MMRLHAWGTAIGLALTGVGAATADAAVQAQVLVRTGDTVDGHLITAIDRAPDINNAGQVAWVGHYAGGDAIFVNHDRRVGTGDVIGGVTYDFIYSLPVINNNGQVGYAFRGTAPHFGTLVAIDQTVQFNYDGGTVESRSLTSIGPGSINDQGVYAWASGYFVADPDLRGVGVITTPTQFLLTQDMVIDGFVQNTSPGAGGPIYGTHALNDSDEALALLSSAGGGRALATQNGVIVQTGDTIDGVTISSLSSGAAINDHGDIAFTGHFNFNTRRGLFTNSRLVMADGAVVGGLAVSFFDGAVDINNAGQVAFLAMSAAPDIDYGVFLDDQLLLKTGDTVNGLIVDTLSAPSLNDAGLVAVKAVFTDGSEAILLIPEPGMGALAMGLAAPLAMGRRRG